MPRSPWGMVVLSRMVVDCGMAAVTRACLTVTRARTAAARTGRAWQAAPVYPAEGVPRRASAKIASLCSMAAAGCRVASCSS